MNVKVIKVETNEYKILVKIGDEELARKEAVKAAISAEAARLSAIAADESEQVAIEKAAQALEDAAAALASKQDAESAATDSGISATASELAKVLSEAAKEISIEEAGKSFVSATESAESAEDAEAAKNQIVDKINFANAQQGDLLRNVAGIFVPERPDLAIVRAFYRIQTALIPRLIQHEGVNITGNGALTNFTDPISGLSYKILSGLVSDTSSPSSPAVIYLNGLDLSNTPNNKGIILAIDSTNYIEFFWNTSNVCVFRRIANGSVVSTESTTIGNYIRATPYQVAINIGGVSNRTGIGFFITCAERAIFSFNQDTLNYRRSIKFIAMTSNIVGSVDNNICIAGQKFI